MDAQMNPHDLTLSEYLESLRSGVSITAQGFLEKALCYEEMRSFFARRPDVAAYIASAEGKELEALILRVAAHPEEILVGEIQPEAQRLPQFAEQRLGQRQSSDVSGPIVSEAVGITIKNVARLRQREVDGLNISQKIDAFVAGLRTQQRETAKRVLSGLLTPVTKIPPDEVRRDYIRRAESSGASDVHEAISIATQFLDTTGLDRDASNAFGRTSRAVGVAIRNITAPPVFTETYFRQIEGKDLTDQVTRTAERTARIVTTVSSPRASIRGINLRAIIPDITIPRAIERGIEKLTFLNAWDAAGGLDGVAAGLTLRLGKAVAGSPAFQRFIQYRNQETKTFRGQLKNIAGGASDIINTIFRSPPPEDMLDYLEAVYKRGGAPNEYGFFLARLYASHPKHFHFEFGASPLDWILQFGEKRPGVAASAGTTAKGILWITKEGAKDWAIKFLTSLGFLSGSTVEALSGPVGWAVFVVVNVLPFLWRLIRKIGNGIGSFFAAGGFKIADASRAIAAYAQYIFNAPPHEDWFTKHGLLTIVLIAICLPLVATILMMNVRLAAIPTRAGGPTQYTGPLQYAGPLPAGALSCLNYNVAPDQFCDSSGCVNAGPMTADQGASINQVLESEAGRPLGLYNCLLGCPSNKVGIYADGESKWWGWTYDSGAIVLYNGFFASGGAHQRIRLIAHEFAHVLNGRSADIFNAFYHGTTDEPAGYCGRPLGTYPGNETVSETFAEAAAMYLSGEERLLKTLCPAAYSFMDRLFRRCSNK